MRQVISLSLSPELMREVDRAVKAMKASSRSEFLRQAVREWVAAHAVRPRAKAKRRSYGK
jgi:metal-responsive CopG/Arc/MetJ family transcriptional regulator